MVFSSFVPSISARFVAFIIEATNHITPKNSATAKKITNKRPCIFFSYFISKISS